MNDIEFEGMCANLTSRSIAAYKAHATRNRNKESCKKLNGRVNSTKNRD